MPRDQHFEVMTVESDRNSSEAMTHAARLLGRPSLVPVRVAVIAAAAESLVLALCFWFILFASTPVEGFSAIRMALVSGALSLLSVVLIAVSGGYALSRLQRPKKAVLPLVVGLGSAMIVIGLWSQLPDQVLARAALVASLLVVLPMRLLFARGVRWAVASGLTARRAVLAGGGAEAERVARGLSEQTGNDIRICGFFDDRGGERVPDLVLDLPKLGRFRDLVEFCRMAEIDLVILCLPPDAERRIASLLEQFRVLPVQVYLSACNDSLHFPDRQGGALFEASFHAERRLAKRMFDLMFGTLLLAIFAPLMALVAMLVRLDSPGPVFFTQQRHGYNDRKIRVWKFRTMFSNRCDEDAREIVTRGDPRVTRLGRILRKTSIDELPQLFNVLAGTLSLVGPRPHAIEAQSSRQQKFTQIVSGYSARHRLPPGITGWAQIHGFRGEIDDPDSLRQRFAHDLYYIDNWSLWLDLKVLLQTPFCLFDTSRAY